MKVLFFLLLLASQAYATPLTLLSSNVSNGQCELVFDHPPKLYNFDSFLHAEDSFTLECSDFEVMSSVYRDPFGKQRVPENHVAIVAETTLLKLLPCQIQDCHVIFALPTREYIVTTYAYSVPLRTWQATPVPLPAAIWPSLGVLGLLFLKK